MAAISAADVKQLREKTGLPLMDCKNALTEAGGDEAKAIELLRKRGETIMSTRSDRETAFGRFGLYCGVKGEAGAIVELKCESAPVAGSSDFIQLANDMAEALAKNASVKDVEQLLDLPLPSNPSKKIKDQKDELYSLVQF